MLLPVDDFAQWQGVVRASDEGGLGQLEHSVQILKGSVFVQKFPV